VYAGPEANHASLVVVGCGAEPTLYKDFPEIVRLAKQSGVPNVSMVTNDKILTERHIEFLIDYGLDEVMISVHGTTQKKPTSASWWGRRSKRSIRC
jgi:molybdenum cofactor biosynthesis enzyme MoaA